mgnify:CR=1 FL=1
MKEAEWIEAAKGFGMLILLSMMALAAAEGAQSVKAKPGKRIGQLQAWRMFVSGTIESFLSFTFKLIVASLILLIPFALLFGLVKLIKWMWYAAF